MSIAEIIKQARDLSLQERRQLINLLNDSIAQETDMSEPQSATRDEVRARLIAAGKLSQPNTPANQRRMDDPPPLVLPADARSSESILDEDRAER